MSDKMNEHKLSYRADRLDEEMGADPAMPAQPATPAAPARPADPATPAKPAKPADPAKPGTPGAMSGGGIKKWLTTRNVAIGVGGASVLGLASWLLFFRHGKKRR
jgi:hypothetical protein